jgi:hypothetical protein
MATRAKIVKTLNEVVKPYCTADWCILKEMISCSHTDPRLFIQLKCIERFKYEESERLKTDIGENAAHMEWVVQGYAKAFAEFYHEDLTPNQIYDKIEKHLKK